MSHYRTHLTVELVLDLIEFDNSVPLFLRLISAHGVISGVSNYYT